MTETLLEIEWESPVTPERNLSSLYARLGVPLREKHCPCCGALLYSRRQSSCGYCLRPIPDQERFTEEQSAMVKSVLEEERQRHRQWLRTH